MDSNSVSIPSFSLQSVLGDERLPSIEPDSEDSCILPSALLLGLLGSLVTPTALQMMKDDYKRYLPCAILFFLHVGHLVA
jgi:hypothetical protein